MRRRFAPERLLAIRKPDVELPRYEFDANEARPGRPDVVILPVIAWSDRRQRPQQLAEALARAGRRVFYGAVRGPGEPREPAGVAIDGPGFAAAMAELESILARIETEETDIDALAAELRRAAELLEICRAKIRRAETEVTQIVQQLSEGGGE